MRIVPGTLVNKAMDIEFQGNVESKATMTVTETPRLKSTLLCPWFCMSVAMCACWVYLVSSTEWCPLSFPHPSRGLPGMDTAHTITLWCEQCCTGFSVTCDGCQIVPS